MSALFFSILFQVFSKYALEFSTLVTLLRPFIVAEWCIILIPFSFDPQEVLPWIWAITETYPLYFWLIFWGNYDFSYQKVKIFEGKFSLKIKIKISLSLSFYPLVLLINSKGLLDRESLKFFLRCRYKEDLCHKVRELPTLLVLPELQCCPKLLWPAMKLFSFIWKPLINEINETRHMLV